MHVLLPLANNLEVRKYKLGEYILREGQAPKGLFILTKGQLKVGSEQINMRSKDIYPMGKLKEGLRNFRFRGNFHDMEDRIKMFEEAFSFKPPGARERIDLRDGDLADQRSVALEV